MRTQFQNSEFTFNTVELLLCYRFQNLYHGPGLELNKKNLQGMISMYDFFILIHTIFFSII